MRSRITPESLEQAVMNNRAVIEEIEPDGEIIGFAGIWEVSVSDWFELGALWVAKEWRGTGLGRTLYEKRLALVSPETKLLVITGTMEAAHLALSREFVEVPEVEWYAYLPAEVTCVPCDKDKVPGMHRPDCPYRAKPGKCQLFIRGG